MTFTGGRRTTMDNSTESQKWQHHLSLLREQYVNLYNQYTELQREYSKLNLGERETGFVARLLVTVASLYDQRRYSDVVIKLADRDVPAHKFILSARSDYFDDSKLNESSILDWSHLDGAVASTLIKWIYTSEASPENLSVDLMKSAYTLRLNELVDRCENYLIGTAGVEECVQLYAVAEELGTRRLRDHCSDLISVHWEDLVGEDFKEMPGSLLYKLLKTKSKNPLHAAVRLLREDVVFLYLVEHNNESPKSVNALDQRGESALEIALKTRQPSLARILVENGADPCTEDPKGFNLLQSSILEGDFYSADFIIEQLEANNEIRKINEQIKLKIESTEFEEYEGCTVLHLLAVHPTDSIRPIANKLLEIGIDPDVQDRRGRTALHFSILKTNVPLFDVLVQLKTIDLDKPSRDNETPLHLAAMKQPFDEYFLDKLLTNGAKANPTVEPDTGDTLLHLLARERRDDSALFLTNRCTDDLYATNVRGYTVLHEACKSGSLELCRTLLKKASPPSVDGTTGPLHLAISNTRYEIVEELLRDPNASALLAGRNETKETPLSLAVKNPSEEGKRIVGALLAAGADIDGVNDEGLTLLHEAVLKEDSSLAVFLLESGADMNVKTSNGDTPLQLSVHCRLSEVVEALCNRGVDTSQGCPLWDALESDQEDAASILVKYGADTDCWSSGPDGCRQTLLHRAIDENKEDMAQFLIRSGCDLNAPRKPGPDGEETKDNCTPLHLCCQWGLEQVVQTLVEHGVDVNARDVDGKTPLHVAIQNQQSEIISLLLCHPNIDLNCRDKKGSTQFAAALTVRNHKAAQAILDRQPKAAEQYDNKGRNFLHTAIQKGDMESILFLLSIRVNVNSRVHDATQTPPLHLAATHGNEMLVRSLILAGAQINDADAHRNTALHAAAKAGNSSIVSALLQMNIDFDAVNADGDNALHVAVREGHTSVARTVLTECTLDAEAVNLQSRNPLHELARCGKDNAATICELFLECMPQYPINNTDSDGNTPLLIAYTKGNGNLCRALVKSGACLGTMNKQGTTIFNYQVATKQLLYRLLDSLTQEAPWADHEFCLECGTKFTLTMRKHHCRHCGRILCSKCSGQDVAILKFNYNKPVRVCAVCFDVLQVGAE